MRLLAANGIRRVTPPLDSAYFSVIDTPHAGRGAFAICSIPANTDIFTCYGPSVNIVYKPFRKEVCAHCFEYDRGRKMKVAYMAGDGKEFRGLAWFCSDACKASWMERMGDEGMEALLCIFTALAKHKKAKLVDSSKREPPRDEDIEEAWQKAATCPLKTDIRLITNEDSEDTLMFLLDGIVGRRKRPQAWQSFLSLNPTLLPYRANPSLLSSHIRLYRFLQLHLPDPFLPYCTPETILALITRESGNSFGIWEHDVQDDGEMLGYGTWVEASFFNHSCENNLKKRIEGRNFHFYTTKEVKEGEELLINYIGDGKDAPLRERREMLQKGWGFRCQCAKCTKQELEERAQRAPSG